MNPFAGVPPLAQGGPRQPAPPPLTSRTPQLLWRPQTFRVTVLQTNLNIPVTPLYAARSLAVGLEIYADNTNRSRVLIGNKLLTSAITSPDGIPGNNYFQLDPGRHAYIWTDSPETEAFDVSMYFACQENAFVDLYLHCTQWQPQPLGAQP